MLVPTTANAVGFIQEEVPVAQGGFRILVDRILKIGREIGVGTSVVQRVIATP